MSRNICIFFDGTSNKFGDNLTNVVKIYSIASQTQKLCYIPGVGSIADENEFLGLTRFIKKNLGLALGFGLQEKVIYAYKYLLNHYEEGDRIYLFGFSRGAYTAKVLSGLLFTCGLLERGNDYHIQYAYELYTSSILNMELLNKFKKRFSRKSLQIEFMGLWDSVSSVGSIFRMRNFPFTTNVKNVKVIRHALAIDERRALFKQNSTFSNNDSLEVWFSGVHGDVGGGNIEMESALSKIPLKWIIDEAVKNGFEIEQSLFDRYVTSENELGYASIDVLGIAHRNNFFSAWLLLEILPRYKTNYSNNTKSWIWPLGRKRTIEEGSNIHVSVKKRQKELEYKSYNFPKEYEWIS